MWLVQDVLNRTYVPQLICTLHLSTCPYVIGPRCVEPDPQIWPTYIHYPVRTEMSKLTRDGTAEPVSRDQILRREREQRILYFPCSAADHEQDWQPCPVVRAIRTNTVLRTHTAVVTHIYIYIYAYYTTVNRARIMYMSANKKYIWYTNSSSTVPVHIHIWTYHGYSWPRAGLATLRGWSIIRCYKEVVAVLTSSIHKYRSSAIIVLVCCTNKQSWCNNRCLYIYIYMHIIQQWTVHE